MELYVDIQKKFPEFLLNVKFESNKDRIGVLGASGSGKSMTLRCISGLVKPDAGRIVLNGRTLFDSEKGIYIHLRHRKIGFVFQNYALFPHLTVYQNIAFGLNSIKEKERKRIVLNLIEKFHLRGVETCYPMQISGGQQQRVALARTLAVEPDILLLDEPFSALDNHLRAHMIKEMIEYLKEFKKDTIIVSHDIDETYKICEDLAVLYKGEVKAIGDKRCIFEYPQNSEVARVTGCKNISRALKVSNDIIDIPDWGIKVKTKADGCFSEGVVGIRANHIKFAESGSNENVYLAWISDISETPFRKTIYLKLLQEPKNASDFHIQWEISAEKCELVKDLMQPLNIYLPPDKILYMEN